ncbi:MAG TPA: nuclear transport factor 2 family protein [Thermoleophilaceae bacterium]|nr:nuclear transport factor 2 family protein [Thermoleophilaceae bacterium]
MQTVRDGYDAVSRGEPEAAFAMLADDVTWDGAPGVEGCRTRAEVEETLRARSGLRMRVEELADAGNKVLVCVRVAAGEIGGDGEPDPYRGREQFFNVITLRDGRVTRIEDHLDRTAALRAAGIDR